MTHLTTRPYYNTPLARMLREKVDKPDIRQREFALSIGYDKPNIFSMFKRGYTKVPLNKAVPFANALGIPILKFLELGSASYPDDPTWKAVIEIVKIARDEGSPPLRGPA